jgi:hypothetical protein
MGKSAGVAPELLRQIQGWTSLGAAAEVVEKVLHAQFGGRREAIRTFKFLELSVQGVGGTFKALGVNISRTGLLFRITDERFAGEKEQQHLMPYTARIWQNFNGGFHVFLESGLVARESDIVRVSGYCGRKSSLVLVGCRFREELTREECDLLGVAYEDGEDQPD